MFRLVFSLQENVNFSLFHLPSSSSMFSTSLHIDHKSQLYLFNAILHLTNGQPRIYSPYFPSVIQEAPKGKTHGLQSSDNIGSACGRGGSTSEVDQVCKPERPNMSIYCVAIKQIQLKRSSIFIQIWDS